MTPNDELNLTAYALGELPADDRPAVEAILQRDPAARAYVDGLLATADTLRTALAAEPTPSLSGPQRAAILTHLPSTPTPVLRASANEPEGSGASANTKRLPARPHLRWPARLALAACLLAGLTVAISLFLPSLGAARRTARQMHQSTEAHAELQQALIAPTTPGFPTSPAPPSPFSYSLLTIPPDSTKPEHKAAEPTSRLAGGDRRYFTGEYSVAGRSHWDGSVAWNDNHVAAAQGPASYFGVTPQSNKWAATRNTEGIVVNGVALPNSKLFGDADLNTFRYAPPNSREAYDRIIDNLFLAALDNPLSTFSIDVDTASYANVRRFITSGSLPPPDAVRIEELINYFDYDYSAPADNEAPFAAHVEVAAAPWNGAHRLVRIGLKGYEVDHGQRGPTNLVFLLDVSGSMNSPDKLPLVKAGMKRLVAQLRPDDRVAIVVYAGASGLVLDSTIDHDAILAAIDALQPGGSTNGAAGIELAYDIATKHRIPGVGVNRVILCTDGDFNVGVTDRGQLTRLIEEKAKSGVYLSVLGFGTGNLQDATMEELSNKGDGNYAYIDSIREAEKVLIEQMGGTLVAIAKDVKIQVEFNPAKVAAYRLIGYENRLLAKEDFNDDTKDAGDIGSGHTVTALYEVIPAQSPSIAMPGLSETGPLKYQRPAALTDAAISGGDLLTLKLRYKAPDAAKEQGTSKLIEVPVADAGKPYAEASADFKFAAAIAAFGMILRDSPHKGTATFDAVIELAGEGAGAPGSDPRGYRHEFVELAKQAKTIAERGQEK